MVNTAPQKDMQNKTNEKLTKDSDVKIDKSSKESSSGKSCGC
jgi:hypothetical protein